ncbi:proteasome activator complex subunit 4A-like [Tubulanus polymorphus]|uniref:proteasome activator complex subunit 4A-like n=1 Tax=Tubulanus polymorphus TaxID=672921 RepID=UPI003DA69C37
MPSRFEQLGFEPQKEIVYNKHLPYVDELDAESNRQLADIKAYYGLTAQLRDIRVGGSHWCSQLSRYIRLYGRKFSKEDHVNFIRLTFELVTIPDLESSLIVKFAGLLSTLLKKTDLLTRDDLQLPWRPLYVVMEKTLYSKYEPHGLELLPHTIDGTLKQLAKDCNPYFSVESTQEMLEEWRPLLCPFDVTMMKGVQYLSLFLPQFLPPEFHDRGFKLWLDEFFSIWDSINASLWDENLRKLFSRIASYNIGYIDWEPLIPKIFTRIMKSFALPVGSVKVSFTTHDNTTVAPLADWVVAMIGHGSSAQDHLTKLFQATESYFYPSNFGKYTIKLSNFVLFLTKAFVRRLDRERHHKDSWWGRTRDGYCLTEDDITAFVLSVKPALFLLMFGKLGVHMVLGAFQNVVTLRPELIIPSLLEKTYPAMETLTEHHRLLSCMTCIAAAALPMMKVTAHYSEGRQHILPLLQLSMPGIDPNDPRKSLTTMQFVSLVVALVPIVDCSQAIHVRTDLTDEERELCLQTAQFEDFILQFLDRVFNLIENYSGSVSTPDQANHGPDKTLNPEEKIMEMALLSTFRTLLGQSSSKLFKVALDRLFRFVSTKVLEISMSGRLTGGLCRAAATARPEDTLKKFLPHLHSIIMSHATAEEISKEENLDTELLWNLLCLSQIVRCRGTCVLVYMDRLIEVLDFTLQLNSKQGYTIGASLLSHILQVFTHIYALDFRGSAEGYDRPFEEYLPIRDWGVNCVVDDVKMKWHVPSKTEKEAATMLLRRYLIPNLDKLMKFSRGEMLSRDLVLQSLVIIQYCVKGAAVMLPTWNSDPLDLVEHEVALKRHDHVCGFDDTIEIDGKNVRQMITECLCPLQKFLLESSEDDTKSLLQLLEVYNQLILYDGVRKNEFDARWKNFHMAKKATEDKIRGKKKHLRAMVVDRCLLQHELRILNKNAKVMTELHRELFVNLFLLSTSRYSEVRKRAQSTLALAIEKFAYSYKVIIGDILKCLSDNQEVEHHQFKGALHVVLSKKKKCLATKRNWDVVGQLWPAIVKAQHSEKPSIIAIIESIIDRIHKDLHHPVIYITTSENCIEASRAMWNSKPEPSAPQASPEQIQHGLKMEQERNQKNVTSYLKVLHDLVKLVKDGNLQWRFSQISMELAALLLRPDVPVPADLVAMVTEGLVHDALNVRKISVAALVAILKTQKVLSRVKEVDPFEISGMAPPGGVVKPGERADYAWHLYKEEENVYESEQTYESCVYVEKPHWGYYTWPKKLKCNVPPSEQPVNIQQFTDAQKIILDSLMKPEFIEKLMKFLALEETKGKDRFHTKYYMLFKGLFRNYGDVILPLLKPYVERLVEDVTPATHESSQRCAAEVLTGLMRGCKHWTYNKVTEMWNWLIPLLRRTLVNLSIESVRDWGTALATASESRDPRKLRPLFEMLMDNPLSGDGGSFNDASRLCVLQGALGQQEWRVPTLSSRLLAYLMPLLNHPYENVRERMGSVLNTILMFDYDWCGVNRESKSPNHSQFIRFVLPKIESLKEFPISSNNGHHDNGLPGQQAMDDDGQQSAVSNGDANSERKSAICILKTTMKFLRSSFTRPFKFPDIDDIYQFLTILCQQMGNKDLSNLNPDLDLQKDCLVCGVFLAQMIVDSNDLPGILKVISQVTKMSSWRAREGVLSFLQLLVFYNLYIFSNADIVNSVRDIILSLLGDEQLEVREMAATTLGGFLHCGYLKMDDELMTRFEKLSGRKLKKKQIRALPTEALISRHAGVLGLSACIQAYPYDVPEFMPQILMDLCEHIQDPQPIQLTVKKTLSDFRRTHQDSWHDHKLKFTDDQLCVLTDLLVSPNYYA